MKASITRRLIDTTPMIPGGYNAKLTKCSECRKRFERLSESWVYKVNKDGKPLWQCSWRCHRIADKRLNPPKELRGEKLADTMENRWKEKNT